MTADGARPDAAPASADLAPHLERLFAIAPEARTQEIEAAGDLPADLAGTYYVIGPGRFARGDVAYRHWLDGDGLVCSLAFRPGEPVSYVQRPVESLKRRDEAAAGRALYRAFGTSFPGDRLVRGMALASPVNVSVYPVAGRLLAFGEQGLPWELDPATLETRGEHDFGRLNPVSPFSAHPAFDPASGEMVNFGISFSADRPALNLYTFGADGTLASRRRLPLPWPCSVHDFALTERLAVFYLNPYLLDMSALMSGATVLEALSWEPERGSFLLVVDRASGSEVARVPIGERYCLHHAGSFESETADGRRRLTVDVVELEEPVYPDYQVLPDLFTDVRPARPVRLEIDLAAGRLADRREIDTPGSADFPTADPRLAGRPLERYWMLAISKTGQPGRKFFDRLVAVAPAAGEIAETWTAPEGRYLGGEPVFLPAPGTRPEDGAGYVLCQELDPTDDRAAFVLFDATEIAAGPLARLELDEPVPPLFHATFKPL